MVDFLLPDDCFSVNKIPGQYSDLSALLFMYTDSIYSSEICPICRLNILKSIRHYWQTKLKNISIHSMGKFGEKKDAARSSMNGYNALLNTEKSRNIVIL